MTLKIKKNNIYLYILFHFNRMESPQEDNASTIPSEDSGKFGVNTNTCRHGSRRVSGDGCAFCGEVS